MKRNLKLALLAVATLAMPACIGGYAPGQAPEPGTPGGTTGGGGSGGNAGTAGGGGTGGGGTGGGGGGGGGATGMTAKQMFTTNVQPILMRCSASTCHGGTVTTPTQFAYSTATLSMYDNIVGYTARVLGNFDKTQATILSKITAGGHNGQSYSATDISNIGGWLDQERTERAASGTGTDPRTALLKKWSGCMVKTEWDAAGVATAWAQKTTDTTNTACQQCHVNAQGFFANADSTRMFNVLTTTANPAGGWFLEMYFTVDMTTDPANPKIILNKDLLTRASMGYAQHEKFSVTTDRNGGAPYAYDKLTTFYNQTMAHLTAGTCGQPTLGNPTPP